MAGAEWSAEVFDQAFQFMGLLDLDGRLIAANQTALSFIGQPEEAVLGRPFWETPWWSHDPPAQERLRQAVAVARGGETFRCEMTNRSATGAVAVVDFSLTPVRDRSGAVVCLLPEGRDITAFAEQRAALAQEEAKLRLLFTRSRDGLLLLDGDRFTDCNPAVLEMMRCTEPEFLRLHPWDLSPPVQPDGRGSQEKALEMISLAHAQGVHRFEWTHRRADGEDFPVEVTLIPIPLRGRQVLYTTWRDVSARKAAEASLRTSEARFREVAELTGQAIYDRDLASGRTVWAGAVEAITGVAAEVLERGGKEAFLARLEPEDAPAANRRVAAAELAGGPFELEYRYRRPDGAVRVLADRGTVRRDPGGGGRCLGAVSDVTRLREAERERLALERQMLHTQKLESLGILAGGIAHDFNNLLTAILGHLSLAREEGLAAGPVAEHLDGMEHAVRRAAELTRQMLAYSGKGRFQVGRQDLNRAVSELRSLLAASIPKKVRLQLDLCEGLAPLEADAAQLQQVILNLLTNAADAIGDREGLIAIRTAPVFLDEGRLRAEFPHWPMRPGPHVLLEVADDGAGMAPEVMGRIFEPFFTTKQAGRGLGLSAIQGILRGHRAGLRITSAPGRGSTFQLCFPASSGGAAAVAPAAAPAKVRFEGAVLLVDDEPEIRQTTGRALAELGFEVLTASDGEAAVERVAAHGARLRLVIMDLTMPRMDGLEALAALRRLSPSLPVLLSSGFSAQEASHGGGPDSAGFLQKPYSLEELRRAVAAALRQ